MKRQSPSMRLGVPGFATAGSPPDVVSRTSDLHRRTARDIVRHLALDALSWREWLPGTNLYSGSAHVQFLLLHHVFDDEAAAFGEMLRRLQNNYQFISYSDAVDRILMDRIDGAYLAISFDDGLKCCRRAAEIMADYGATACFFVCPPIIGETNRVEIARFCHDRLRHPITDFLSWDDIEHLLNAGNEVGGHTLDHVNLAAHPIGQAHEEIRGSYEMLTARIGSVRHFAWPYGQFSDISAKSVRTVFAAGYQSCASGARGCHGPTAGDGGPHQVLAPERLCIYRQSVVAGWPHRHVRYFLRRAARRPLTVDETWPSTIRPCSVAFEDISCTSPSTPFRSHRAAG